MQCRDLSSQEESLDIERKVQQIMSRFDSVRARLDKFHIANLKTLNTIDRAPSSVASLDMSFEGV
jgi:hypothetical protein